MLLHADRAYHELASLKKTGTVLDYLTEVDRLNNYAKLSDLQVINIIISNFPHSLRVLMAYEHLRSDPPAWKQKLIEMDIIHQEFQSRNRHAPQEHPKTKNRTFKDRVQRLAYETIMKIVMKRVVEMRMERILTTGHQGRSHEGLSGREGGYNQTPYRPICRKARRPCGDSLEGDVPVRHPTPRPARGIFQPGQ